MLLAELPHVDLANIATGGFAGGLLVYLIKVWIPRLTTQFSSDLAAERASNERLNNGLRALLGLQTGVLFELVQAVPLRPDLMRKVQDVLKKTPEEALTDSVVQKGAQS